MNSIPHLASPAPQGRNGFFKYLLAGIFITLSGLLPVRAAETADVDIHVSLSVAKSITVNATSYDYGALSVNASSVTATPIIVTNDSTALIETYTLQATNAISDSEGQDWTLAASTGTDQFVLSGQFSDSPPANIDANWAQDALSTIATTCTEDVFGNGSMEESGKDVLPAENRNLWFRIQTPSSVTDGGPHTVTVTISVF